MKLDEHLAQIASDDRMRVDKLDFIRAAGKGLKSKRTAPGKKVKTSRTSDHALKPVEKGLPYPIGGRANGWLGWWKYQTAVPVTPSYDPYAIRPGAQVCFHRLDPPRLRKSASDRKLKRTAKKEPSHAEVYPIRRLLLHRISGRL